VVPALAPIDILDKPQNKFPDIIKDPKMFQKYVEINGAD